MTIQLKVPSIACEGCAQTIALAIHNQYPEAQVSIDVDGKMVSVDLTISPQELKQIITDAGHTVTD